MARLLRNFRNRRLSEPVDTANISYAAILESVLALDQDFYLFPESYVPSLQTLCIKSVMRRRSELFAPYHRCSGERLLRDLPPGPFDRLAAPLCDLLCDFLLWLRDPGSAAIPLYCVLSPYTRCLCLHESLSDASAVSVERLLAVRARRVVELTWIGSPVTTELLNLLTSWSQLAVFITEEVIHADDVAYLLSHCAALRVLQIRDHGRGATCLASLHERGIVCPGLQDLRLVVDDVVSAEGVARVFPALGRLAIRPFSVGNVWRMCDGTFEPPWFDRLATMSLTHCETPVMLEAALPALTTLTLDCCVFAPKLLSLHPRLTCLSIDWCVEPPDQEDRALVSPTVEKLHLTCRSSDHLALDWVCASFPGVRQLSMTVSVTVPADSLADGRLSALRRLRLGSASSVLSERLLAALPLHQLSELALQYEADDDAPLAMDALRRCRRLAVLELEGFSCASVPVGLRLETVHQLCLRGGTCRPQMVHWLLGCLPRLRQLVLVNVYLVTETWAPLLRHLRQTGVSLELEGGCTIPSWRRGGIRMAVSEDL